MKRRRCNFLWGLGAIHVVFLYLLYARIFSEDDVDKSTLSRKRPRPDDNGHLLPEPGPQPLLENAKDNFPSGLAVDQKIGVKQPIRNWSTNGNDPLRLRGTRFVFNNRHICKYGGKEHIANGSTPFHVLLVLIQSRRGHFLERATIRNTYGSLRTYKKWDIRVVFLVGKGRKKVEGEKDPNDNGDIHVRLAWEFDTFGDIIMGPFFDTEKRYSVSTTYQHVMGIRWGLRFCERAEYVAVANDDFFVDTLEIVSITIPWMKSEGASFFCNEQSSTLIRVGVGIKGSDIIEDNSRLQLEKSHTRVEYCSGGAYLVDFKAMKKLYTMVSHVPFHKDEQDDIFITGRLRAALLEFKDSGNNITKLTPPHSSDNLKIIHHERTDEDSEYSCFFVAKWFAKIQKLAFHKRLPGRDSTIVQDFFCLWWNALENKGMFINNQRRTFLWAALAQ